MSECLFCRIVAGEIPATVILREDGFIAFHDIAPKAPVHILVIPERHVASMAEVDQLTDGERAAMGLFISRVASAAGLDSDGYRVATNTGSNARQEIMHLHWHVLGGGLLSQSM